MNNSRTGKIARFPSEIREELNRRLQNGAKANTLVKWLNGLPVVQVILFHEFGGKPVREQNISTWRTGGYREWLLRQDALGAVQRVNADVIALRDETGNEFTDNVAFWLTTRFVAAAQKMEKEEGEIDWRTLREFCSDLVALRRGDHSSARLIIDSKRQIVQETLAMNSWKKRVIQGLETLKFYVDKHPKAKAAFEALAKEVSTPFDEMEGAQ